MPSSSEVSRSPSPHETAPRNIPRRNRAGQAGDNAPEARSSGLGRDGIDFTGGSSRNPDSLPLHSTPEEYAHIREVEYRHADEIITLLSGGDVNSIRARLADGVDLDVQNRNGDTPLNFLCDRGELNIIEMLLENGAGSSINLTNNKGRTPLVTAIFSDRADVVKMLLDHDADPDIADKSGMTPHQIATAYTKKIAKILSDHHAMKTAPRRSNDGQRPVAEWRNSPTDRYDPEREMYYYFRHHTNGPDTSHWVEDSSDEQVPLPKQKIVKSHHHPIKRSQGTTSASKASKRGRDYEKTYKTTEARADSPHFEKAVRPRKLGLFGKYDLPDGSDRFWKRWEDLKPHKGDKASDKDGPRFRRRPPAPSASDRKPTVRFADSTPNESVRLNTTYSRPVAPVNQPNYREPSARDVLMNPAYRNLRNEAREDIARYNNARMPADRPEDIVALTLTEPEIRELHHIFQGPPAGDELLRERLRDVVQREFLRIGPGDPREVPRQPATLPSQRSIQELVAGIGKAYANQRPTLRSGHQPQEFPGELRSRRSQEKLDVEIRARIPVAPTPRAEEDNGIFDFELNEKENARPVEQTHSKRTAATSERGRIVGKKYTVSKAREVSPGFRAAFPRIRERSSRQRYQKPGADDPIWNRWADLKPTDKRGRLDMTPADSDGHRFVALDPDQSPQSSSDGEVEQRGRDIERIFTVSEAREESPGFKAAFRKRDETPPGSPNPEDYWYRRSIESNFMKPVPNNRIWERWVDLNPNSTEDYHRPRTSSDIPHGSNDKRFKRTAPAPIRFGPKYSMEEAMAISPGFRDAFKKPGEKIFASEDTRLLPNEHHPIWNTWSDLKPPAHYTFSNNRTFRDGIQTGVGGGYPGEEERFQRVDYGTNEESSDESTSTRVGTSDSPPARRNRNAP